SVLPVLAQTDSELALLIDNVTQAFVQAQIVPDLLPSFTPYALLNATFPADSTSAEVDVTPGALLPENQTAVDPAFTLIKNDTDPSETFVIALVDPDAPSPLDSGNFIVLGSSSPNLFNHTPALLEFFSPTPPAGSPPHRYVVLVYNQPDNFATVASPVVNASTPRFGFNLAMFSTATNLTSPIAGNYFLVGPNNDAMNITSSGPTSTSLSIGIPSTSLLSETLSPNSPVLSTSIMITISSTITATTPVATPTTANVMAVARPTAKLPPGANRILFVKNLNYQITGEDLYDLFGRYGTIRQIRIGNEQKTKGTAFVVFDDVMDAKNALDHLNGFHLQERYIVVLYHMPAKQDAAAAKADLAHREEELAALKKKHNIGDE
ncbi:hypothetical protein H0H92_003857, partial [Tricholoma furcatifolium]